MENQNPGRSVKDRTAKHILLSGIKKGLLKENGRIYEGTSGSTGISLSLVGKSLGLNSTIFLEDHTSKEKVKKIL